MACEKAKGRSNIPTEIGTRATGSAGKSMGWAPTSPSRDPAGYRPLLRPHPNPPQRHRNATIAPRRIHNSIARSPCTMTARRVDPVARAGAQIMREGYYRSQ